jgi:serine/threonine protein kinase
VRRRLGSGGFATVWLAYDEQLDAEVAVKVLADNWAHDDSVRRRFLEEGRFLRRVESEHVVQVHDVGELEDGRPFLVLTYADRGTLADRLKKEPLALDTAVGVIVQVGRGLQALHRRGLLHRDVKPANVLFRSTDEGDRAVLSDLGLGKSLDEVSRITMPGGTPSYVAPEQAMGDRLDQRADQYSLGAVAYAALTGRSPHQVDGLGAAGRVEAAPPPSSLGFAVPDRVDAAIVRALDPDREKRWPDVASFTRELVGALDETTHNFVAPAKKAASADAAEARAIGTETELASAPAETVDPVGETTALSDSNQPTVIKTAPDSTASSAEALPGPDSTRARPEAEAATAPVALLDAQPGAKDTATGETTTAPKKRRRGRWVVAALLALILGGGAGYVAQRYYEPHRVVGVTMGGFTAHVPKELAGFVVQGNWRPPGSPSDQPAFRVSKDDNWGAVATSTPGLFVGVMPLAADPGKLLTAGKQFGCADADVDPTQTSMNGAEALERISSGCPGGNILLQRIATFNGYSLLVQVQVSDQNRALEIANSVSYAPEGNS